MVERKERDVIVAEHNGQVFRFNDLVHVLEGTGPGVPKKKTELMKAWFKGVDATQDKFICRPVIGYTRVPFLDFRKERCTS
jgi:hypothetical protein